MIETGKQTREALEEILELTGWTKGSLGDRLSLTRPTVYRILSGRTRNSTTETMEIIHKELVRVRKVHADVAN